MADSEEDGEERYDINDVRAERWNPSKRCMDYLIEWDGYRMFESTFEPKTSLEQEGPLPVLETWRDRKKGMANELFQTFNEENESRYNIMYAEFTERDKRPKKLDHRKKRSRRVIEDDSDDDDTSPTQNRHDTQSSGTEGTDFKYFIDIRDVMRLGSLPPPIYVPLDYIGPSIPDDTPPVHQRQDLQPQVEQKETGPTASQELYRDLFVDSQDSNPIGPPTPTGLPDDGLFVEQQAIPRPAPFHQSDEGGDNSSNSSSDSLDDEPLARRIAQAKMKSQSEGNHNLGRSILSPEIAKSGSVQHQSKPLLEKHKSKGSGRTKILPLSRADATTENAGITNKSTSMSPKVQRPSGSSLQVSSTTTARDGRFTGQRISATSDPASSVASLSKPAPTVSSSRPTARRTGPSLKSSNPIRMTNNSEAPKRKQWDTDKHFNTLKFRRIAEVRARTEGNPDLNALDFVGAAPSNLSRPNPKSPVDNPYGRREVRTRRVQEDAEENESRHRPTPLADWEADKVPLVCYNWRLSNSCAYPPSKCVFLHRNQDENGRDLPIGDEHGYVPPKYRKPPVTCLFWLEDPKGCSRPDRECAFTHRNTGYKLLEGTKGETVPIDPSLPPINERASSGCLSPNQHTSTPIIKPPSTNYMPSTNLTCHFWLDGSHGCNKSEADCKFAHRNTGWALQEGIKGKVVQIDSSLLPVSERVLSERIPSKYSISTPTNERPSSGFLLRKDLVCRYWLEATEGCTDANCEFAHRNTGWTLSNGARVQVDPLLVPYSERATSGPKPLTQPAIASVVEPPHVFFLPSKKLTCLQWLENNIGCKHADSDCEFAHSNTGWKQEDDSDKPVQIDPTLLPVSERRTGGYIPEKHREYPLTCHWWLEGTKGCRKPDADCNFAHSNTGWKLKAWPSGERIQIDPSLTPVSARKFQVPIVPRTNPKEFRDKTCWYWAKSKCLKSDDQCLFKHYLTDVLAGRKPGESPVSVCLPYLEGRCVSGHLCVKAHVDPALVKSEGRSKNKENPNLIPLARRDASPDVQEHSIQHDLGAQYESSDQQDMTSAVDMPITTSPLVEQVPSSPPADRPQELSIPEANAAVPQQSTSTDLESILPQARLSSLVIKHEIEEALQVSFTSLFEWSNDGTEQIMLDRRAILLFHPVDHQEELELLTRWLLMHHVEVSSAWFPGAWHYHSEHIITGGSGIVIAHPSFDQFSDFANFGQMLRKQVRLWSLGVQTNIEHDPAALNCASDTRLDCIEIFPVGGLIYITEDVFEEMPQLALKIVRLFCAKIDNIHKISGSKYPWQEVQEVNLHWRLCVRPELMEYLFQRCEEQEEELEAGDASVMARAELYTLLSDGKLIEQDTPVRPIESKCDSFYIMSERRVIAEGQPLDYFEALARSREEATTRMVQYYGCVHLDTRRDYRHFYIVHTDPRAPCATRWKSKNQVVSDVITPKQCIRELSKDGLGPDPSSMFDFYERYLLGSSKDPANDVNAKTSASTQPGSRKGSLTLTELASRG